MEEKEVNIVTYNLLSPHLSSPEVFHACSLADLDPVARLQKIREVMNHCIERSYIICLQEVCLSWSAELRLLFEQAGYAYVDAISGCAEHECFGQATAYPRKHYELVRSKTQVLGSSIRPRAASSGSGGFVAWVRSFRWDTILNCIAVLLMFLCCAMHWMTSSGLAAYVNLSFLDYSEELLTVVIYVLCLRMAHHIASLIKNIDSKRPPLSPVKAAARKSRRVLSLCLRKVAGRVGGGARERQFTVTNYHMPCSFKEPVVMFLHMQALLLHFDDFRGEAPGILAGDMNIRPSSWLYQYMLCGFEEGRLKSEYRPVYADEMEPVIAPYRDELPPMRTVKPVTSAHAAVNGSEPQFTCKAVTSFAGEFSDTLDYVLFSSGFNAWLCNTMHEGAGVGRSLPNAHQGSDHLPLMAILRFTEEGHQ